MDALRSRVISTVDEMKNDLTKFLQDLIRIPTENPPGRHFTKCANLLQNKLSESGLKVRRIEVPKAKLQELGLTLPRITPLARWVGTVGRPVLQVNGHYDVKSADWALVPGTKWTVDPFSAVIKNDRVCGRGASDMKSGVAAMIIAAAALKEAGVKLKGTLEIAPVPDEEIGGLGGSKFLVEEGYVKPDMIWVTEPGGPNTITIGERGRIRLEITTLGLQPGHWEIYSGAKGINAIDKMATVVTGLRSLKSDVDKKTSKYPFPMGTGHARLEISDIQNIKDLSKATDIPEKCMITVTRSLIPEERPEDAIAEMNTVLQKLKQQDEDLRYESRIVGLSRGWIQAEESKIVKIVAKNIREVTREEPKFVVSPGACDIRFFAERFKIPAIWYGPGVRGTSHQADEYVTISNLVACTKVMALSYMDLLGFEK